MTVSRRFARVESTSSGSSPRVNKVLCRFREGRIGLDARLRLAALVAILAENKQHTSLPLAGNNSGKGL